MNNASLSPKHKRTWMGLDAQGQPIPGKLVNSTQKPSDGFWVEAHGVEIQRVPYTVKGTTQYVYFYLNDRSLYNPLGVHQSNVQSLEELAFELNSWDFPATTFSADGSVLVVQSLGLKFRVVITDEASAVPPAP